MEEKILKIIILFFFSRGKRDSCVVGRHTHTRIEFLNGVVVVHMQLLNQKKYCGFFFSFFLSFFVRVWPRNPRAAFLSPTPSPDEIFVL
jgi:hypothetical protein